MLRTNGIIASSGIIVGKALIFRHDLMQVQHELCKSEAERRRQLFAFEEACKVVAKELDSLIALAATKEETDILFTHKLMVEDPEFASSVKEQILKEGKCAPYAVEYVMDGQVTLLSNIDSALFKERISDIQNVSDSILRELLKQKRNVVPNYKTPVIIVADYLTPAEIVGMEKTNLLGFVLVSGGKTSHVAVLAHSLNIPCLVGLSDLFNIVNNGDLIILDAIKGEIVVNPEPEVLSEAKKQISFLKAQQESYNEDSLLPAITTDGVRVELKVNISGAENLDKLFNTGAEGVGLFRTEFLLMNSQFPTEAEETDVYTEIVEKSTLYGPLTIRTWDVGGDKVVDALAIKEENPILGWRAIRFCLANKELFVPQLRSILRASAFGKVQIMFPMISGVEELEESLALLEEVKQELRRKMIPFDEQIPVGIMIEVPSAALCSDALAKKVDFFSVGTNDLIQYTLAVDRGNEKIAYLYNPLHPGVLQLLKLVADNAHKNNIKVGMCGEMASVELFTPLLIGLGFDELSMNSQSISKVRHVVRSISYSESKDLADKLLAMTKSVEIETYLKEWTNGRIGNN
ncbi:MAG: phosphoenolpyruvate--protein phosphotransferase [Spirochaetales bacterium]|nr:phosphoenolpyruvate--protein phosphotransferase [Spirochaetales bacterium]